MMFVDFQNASIGAQTLWPGANLDFKRLEASLVGDRHLAFRGALVYLDLIATEGVASPATKRLFTYLRRNGFIVVIPRVHDRMSERKKCVDTSIAVDMVKYAYEDAYDTAILVSGDNDLAPAVKAVQRTGRKVEVASFASCFGVMLKRQADKLTFLDFAEGLRRERAVPAHAARQ
jgi:hypothetical protein